MREQGGYGWRLLILAFFLLAAFLGLVGRIIYLGIFKHDFLSGQSRIRSIREVVIPVHRGMITDRNGAPLAISIPVASVWANPKLFDSATDQNIADLAAFLKIQPKSIKKKVAEHQQKEFVYLKRSIPLEKAKTILELKIPGVFLEKGYKRYYPEAESAAHVVGFTNIDDQGQEGMELAYDSWLRGVPGKTRVVKDRMGNTIANLDLLIEPQEGRDLKLSIDKRIQYLAYSELKNTVNEYNAESGSVVVLSAKTGEILAMVNSPSYNPNNRKGVSLSKLRNRAVIDLFEPGSTIKAFTIANALDSGKYNVNTTVDTNPGVLKVGKNLIYDNNHKNHGVLTVKGVLQKSSDIGVAKITLSLPPNSLLDLLYKVGFGHVTESGFPGEGVGVLPDNLERRPFVLATLSFGYSISATLLQLAQSYQIIASEGALRPVTFLKKEGVINAEQVLPKTINQQILSLLESVLDTGGTGSRARVAGYRVAGKTGTAHVASAAGGYYKDRHFSNFVGIAPVSDPQLVVAVVIKSPKGDYHGGKVAAPLFAKIMNGSLRILGITLDDAESM